MLHVSELVTSLNNFQQGRKPQLSLHLNQKDAVITPYGKWKLINGNHAGNDLFIQFISQQWQRVYTIVGYTIVIYTIILDGSEYYTSGRRVTTESLKGLQYATGVVVTCSRHLARWLVRWLALRLT